MPHFSIAPHQLSGEPRGSAPIVPVRVRPKLVFYPGELTLPKGVRGTIYVVMRGEVVKKYSARGGPKVRYKDGSHWADPTPAGTYTLGPRHRHVTKRWLYSTIPWGAEIRRTKSGIVEYKERGVWRPATGEHGRMTLAYLVGLPSRPPEAELEAEERSWFDVNPKRPTGELVKTWRRNDFGKWAFALLRPGKATDYFIHTTPESEDCSDAEPAIPFSLSESHGCIHIKPSDRDAMWSAGHLAAGNVFVVMGYDQKGPP